MSIDPPPIIFSKWAPWRNRKPRNDGPCLGLYLWGHFHKPPAPTPPHPQLPQELIYVGETKRLDLRALTGEQHHRLKHYKETFPADPDFNLLYFSVYRVRSFPDGYRVPEAKDYDVWRVYTQYMEAKIYWEYTKRWEHPPALHYKRTNKQLVGYVKHVGPECTCGSTEQIVARERRERFSTPTR